MVNFTNIKKKYALNHARVHLYICTLDIILRKIEKSEKIPKNKKE